MSNLPTALKMKTSEPVMNRDSVIASKVMIACKLLLCRSKRERSREKRDGEQIFVGGNKRKTRSGERKKSKERERKREKERVRE
jgi:hypothetical protein